MKDCMNTVKKIVSRMTLDEKISQLMNDAPSVERVGLPAYNWWNESLHGVGRAGVATVFPQPIGLAAIFDEDFIYKVSSCISDEVRAKYNIKRSEKIPWLLSLLPKKTKRMIISRSYRYHGITCWSPNINIFRDPRWGRGHETYGEDPYLTSRLGVAYIKGLQGNHPEFMKAVATPKHFAVHSGPEKTRHSFNAKVSSKDLHDTYLPAFKSCITEGKAMSIMTAYNRINGEAATTHNFLLNDILRKEWKFEGYVVSDCGAICDIHKHHKQTSCATESAARALKAGTDLNCGISYRHLKKALHMGLIDESDIDKAIIKLMYARCKLGMFEDVEPFGHFGLETIDSKEHRELALEASRKSIVLLKNDGILPLKNNGSVVAVIGPNSDDLSVLLGNYNGNPSAWITPLSGIRSLFNGEVLAAKGCHLTKTTEKLIYEAVELGKKADTIILFLGLSPRIEGEEGDAYNSDASGDRTTIKLPGLQEKLVQELSKLGKPIVSVLISGSPLDLRMTHDCSSAVLQAWYPGQDGGLAIAEVLFGIVSPAGRLPITFVMSDDDLPPFESYDMAGRTYRYLDKIPMYPFGYGLSYSTFKYENFQIEKNEMGCRLEVKVTNIGKFPSDEVVQFYIKSPSAKKSRLCSFKRVHLIPGQSLEISMSIDNEFFTNVDENGKRYLEHGNYSFNAGGFQPDERSEKLMGEKTQTISFIYKVE